MKKILLATLLLITLSSAVFAASTKTDGWRTRTMSTYKIVMTADTDTYTLKVNGMKQCYIGSSGISSDTINVQFRILSDGAYHSYVNSFGANPFAAANDMENINVAGLYDMKLTRSGGTDGDIVMEIGCSTI